MFLQQQPMPGYWYSNFSGQLIQVRAMLYISGKCQRILLEDIRGKRDYIKTGDWKDMDLVLHSPVVEQQSLVRDH
jgi:hypothetical protein